VKNHLQTASQVENRPKRIVETLQILHSNNILSVHRVEVIMTSLNANVNKQGRKRKPRNEENCCPVPMNRPNAVINNQKQRKKLSWMMILNF
jgi:hypothetical protein